MRTLVRGWFLQVLLAAGLLVLVSAPPAGAKLFTIDANNNDINDLDGSDDLHWVEQGIDVTVRAVDVTVSASLLEQDVDQYFDFSNGSILLDFPNMDVFIIDIVVSDGSNPITEIGLRVSTDPIDLNPAGAGWLLGCDPGLLLGCVHNVPGGGEEPDSVSLVAANAGIPGLALFEFNNPPPPVLETETTRRLFVAWQDTGPQTPLSKDGQLVRSEISSGRLTIDFSAAIVPEPGTASLVLLGVTALGATRRRRHRA